MEYSTTTLRLWFERTSANPDVYYIQETGAGETYGDVGDITAVVGSDMQSDVVGVWSCSEKQGWMIQD